MYHIHATQIKGIMHGKKFCIWDSADGADSARYLAVLEGLNKGDWIYVMTYTN